MNNNSERRAFQPPFVGLLRRLGGATYPTRWAFAISGVLWLFLGVSNAFHLMISIGSNSVDFERGVEALACFALAIVSVYRFKKAAS